MIFQWFFSIFLWICLVIFIVDIAPMATTWVRRIHIGRYRERRDWVHTVTSLGVKWLNQTPTMKINDNNRFIVLDMMKGRYSSRTLQHWQEAALLLGLAERQASKNDPIIDLKIQRFIRKKLNDDGSWKKHPHHVDSAILAYALMKLPQAHGSYKKALDEVWEIIQNHIGSDGTVQYRKHMPNYRYVDTIGFVCPFLTAYGIRYNKPECVELAIKQMKAYEQAGMLQNSIVPCHAYDVNNGSPLGLFGWGRGLGWLAIGMMDTWKELPKKHKYKSILECNIIQFSQEVVKMQRPEGCWNWTVLRSESRADSSTTAILSWFLIQAAGMDEISETCLVHAEKAMHYLMMVTRKDGAVDFSQGDTKDIGVYSMLFDVFPFTQGFCIRAIQARADKYVRSIEEIAS